MMITTRGLRSRRPARDDSPASRGPSSQRPPSRRAWQRVRVMPLCFVGLCGLCRYVLPVSCMLVCPRASSSRVSTQAVIVNFQLLAASRRLTSNSGRRAAGGVPDASPQHNKVQPSHSRLRGAAEPQQASRCISDTEVQQRWRGDSSPSSAALVQHPWSSTARRFASCTSQTRTTTLRKRRAVTRHRLHIRVPMRTPPPFCGR